MEKGRRSLALYLGQKEEPTISILWTSWVTQTERESLCYDVAVFERVSDVRYPGENVDGDYCCKGVGVGEMSANPMGREGDSESVSSS